MKLPSSQRTPAECVQRLLRTAAELSEHVPDVGPTHALEAQDRMLTAPTNTPGRRYELSPGTPPDAVERAFESVLVYHDALRARFSREGGRWRQRIAGLDEQPPFFEVFDLSGEPEASHADWVRRIAADFKERLDVERGPLLRAAYVERGPGRAPWALEVSSHVVTDVTSEWVRARDLKRLFQTLGAGRPPSFLAKLVSFRAYVARAHAYANAEGREDARAWADQIRSVRELPADHHSGPNVRSAAGNVVFAIDPPSGGRVSDPGHVALTATLNALAAWSGSKRHLLLEVGNGRFLFPDATPLRTVGCFASPFPLVLEDGAIDSVREQHGRAPRFELLPIVRALTGDAPTRELLDGLPTPQINFNFIRDAGRDDPSSEDLTATHFPEFRPCLLSFNFRQDRHDRLEARVGYSRNFHRLETIDALAADVKKRLDRAFGR